MSATVGSERDPPPPPPNAPKGLPPGLPPGLPLPKEPLENSTTASSPSESALLSAESSLMLILSEVSPPSPSAIVLSNSDGEPSPTLPSASAKSASPPSRHPQPQYSIVFLLSPLPPRRLTSRRLTSTAPLMIPSKRAQSTDPGSTDSQSNSPHFSSSFDWISSGVGSGRDPPPPPPDPPPPPNPPPDGLPPPEPPDGRLATTSSTLSSSQQRQSSVSSLRSFIISLKASFSS
mmetsp:Transcript_19057/g.43671  ORF Transcript_19057/g.43671 Transcript_19057/m.43671 type:complete len:233 (-) Transcript_19057:274-972(-)